MIEFQQHLSTLEHDPNNAQALAALISLAGAPGDKGGLTSPTAVKALDEARKATRDRGELELTAHLFDVELAATPAADKSRRADLLLEKGRLLFEELFDEAGAAACFHAVLELRPDDANAQELLAHMALVRDNWERIVKKYVEEAQVSSDKQLTSGLYLSVAESYARYRPGSNEVEAHLRKSLDIEPGNRRALAHLERLLRRNARWTDVAAVLERRVDSATTKDERVHTLIALAECARDHLGNNALAAECMRKVLELAPGQPRALTALIDAYTADENWPALVKVYETALKARRPGRDASGGAGDSELGLVLQIAMISWKRLGNLDVAEEYFRRIRKIDAGHAAMLDFYRAYHKERNEAPKLLAVLQAAWKAETDPVRKSALAVETAEIAESDTANPEKAIDSWKAILRTDPKNVEARAAVRRLYLKSEKWNALLELYKEEIDAIPLSDEAGKAARIDKLLEVVAIYRDRLNLDVMVINTYNAILALAPDHLDALDALAQKYEHLGRWNDLIGVLSRKSEVKGLDVAARTQLLRRIAALWTDRFGNQAQAIKPLEELVALAPTDAESLTKLKEIYIKRRQWRALLDVMAREVDGLDGDPDRRRFHLGDMARLAADKLGDVRAAIGIWNRTLELDDHDPEALVAIAALYEKDKRWLALAEILHRQREGAGADQRLAGTILERLGAVYADKLQAPAQAAAVLRDLLTANPGNAKALRVLRELYAQSGDLAALEDLYGGLNAWDDLVDVLQGLADRAPEPAKKLAILERAAGLAESKLNNADKAAKAYERILALDLGGADTTSQQVAAMALIPIYRKSEKWPRLLATYEALLAHTTPPAEKLALLNEIRKLCEERLGNKSLAFTWAARAYELATTIPGGGTNDDDKLLRELERLGADAGAWGQVAAIIARRVAAPEAQPAEKLRLLRELGRIHAVRLRQPAEARAAWERVLALAPDDPEAMTALEELAAVEGRWSDLRAIYVRRSELEKNDSERLEILIRIARLDEDKTGDLDAAARSYQEILARDDKSLRAVRALVKVQAARSDASGLAWALERELPLTTEPEGRVALFLRLGGLYEEHLNERKTSLERYLAALALAPANRQVQTALERFLPEGSAERVPVARALAPVYDKATDGKDGKDAAVRLAQVLEILRGAETDAAARQQLDRKLAALYAHKLADPLNAYEAATRVLAAAPTDLDNRKELGRLAAELSAFDDLAGHLETALAKGTLTASARRELTAELAEVYDDKLDDAAKAEGAWRRTLESGAGAPEARETDARAYSALERLLRAGERWEDLRVVLERRVDQADDADKKELLLQICDLYEGVLDNATGAMAAYQRVLELEPGYGPSAARAYRALERLYDHAGKWSELEVLLGQELGHVKQGAEVAALTFRRADLRAGKLNNPVGAVDLAEEVIAADPQHAGARKLLEDLFERNDLPDLKLRIARLLAPRYEADGMWAQQIRMLEGEHDLAHGASEKVGLLARIAQIQEERLGDEVAAFLTWRSAATTEPSDDRAREALQRLAGSLDAWDDAAATWEEALVKIPATDHTLRGILLMELAQIYDRSLADVARATSAYRRLLEVDPNDRSLVQPAAEALERLYQEQQAWPELVDILHRQAVSAETPAARIGCLTRVAAIQEQKQKDTAAAVATWREVLAEEGEHRAALDALERLHAGRGEARDLIDVLHRRVILAANVGEKRELLGRIAALQERDLKAPGDAIAAYLEILDHVPEDAGALAELARLYRSAGRFTDLLDADERRLALAMDHGDTEERNRLRFEIGELLRDKLNRNEDALERFRQILAEDADHSAALEAVELMLADDDLKLAAAAILQPIYDGRGEHGKLVELYELEADAHDDPRERLVRLRKVADLRERSLDDPDGAFDAHARAARHAVGEPELEEHLAALARLAATRNKIPALVAIYRDVAPDVLDAELQRRLYLDIADLARGKLADVDLARDYYRRVLDAHPEDVRALAALESLYREIGEHEALREILQRKADLAADGDGDARRDALAEIATLCDEQLGRKDDAIAAWEQVLELAPGDNAAAAALERLYTGAERWLDLVELLEKRLGYAQDLAEAVDLRFRIGGLFETHLTDPDKAVENYGAALGGDPHHAGAISALERYLDDEGVRLQVAEILEPIYIARADWNSLIRITEIRLDASADPQARLALVKRIARLHEEQLEDLEGAFKWYGRLFREDPDERSSRDQLLRLATVLGSWEALAKVYQDYLDDESGDRPAVLDVARAVGEVYDRRLTDVEKARAAYRRVLSAAPEDLDTFDRLEDMLLRTGRWPALIEAYDEALTATLDDNRRKQLLAKIAEVEEQKLNATSRAVDAYRAILDLDPDDANAVAQVDRLYQRPGEERFTDLAELLTNRIDRASGDPAAAAALRVRLAEVQEHKLQEIESAIDQYEMVLAENDANAPALAALERLVNVPEHRHRIAQILEPIYRKHDVWPKLVVILDAQLEFVDDKDRRVEMLREVAKLYEVRGQKLTQSMDAIARAWQEDVADEDVYNELERVAGRLGAWEQLCTILDVGVEGIYDYELAARLLARIAHIEEEKRFDRPRAISAWRRVLEVKDDDLDALLALEKLHEAEGQPEELVTVLKQRVEQSNDPAERKALYARIADLCETVLSRRDEAIAAWRQVLGHDDRDLAALDALERLYRQAKEPRALVEILLAKIEVATGDADRRGLRFAAAQVYDKDLRDAFEAIGQYKAVLDADAHDAAALEALESLYDREQSWGDLVEIIDRRAALIADVPAKADLLYKAGRVVEERQAEADQAIDRYRAVLAIYPKHPPTRDALDTLTHNEDTLEAAASALEPIYSAEGLHDKVAELYTRRLAARGVDPSQRRAHVEALALVHEAGREDLGAAFAVWAKHLTEEPDDQEAQKELERLAHQRNRWDELAALYETVLDGTMDADLGRNYALKLAQIYEQALGDLDRAASRYKKALDYTGDEPATLGALDRIYERQQKWDDLAEILARESQSAASGDEQAIFMYRLGDLKERVLLDSAGALEAYREVLERVPSNAAARAALERLLANPKAGPSERGSVIAILEPLYENEGDFARLADLYEHKLSIETSAADRAALLARLAEMAERKLGDPMRALDAVGRWLAEDPTAEDAAGELERLAGAVGRWEDAATRLADVAGGLPKSLGEVERDLHLRRGRILLDAIKDAPRAEAAYRRALELDAQSQPALAALDRIYRGTGNYRELASVLARRADLALDVGEKRAAWAEVAKLRSARLDDEAGAVAAWKQVLDLDEGDHEALAGLAALHEHAERWEDLVNVLDAQARFAPDRAAELVVRRRIAEVVGDKLHALDRAVEAWITIADLAPQDDAALAALANVHRQRQDWLSVQETLARRLALAPNKRVRIELYKELARLAEVERQAPDEAAGYLFQILDEDNANQDAYGALARLLVTTERWPDLVDLYTRQADLHGTLGDREGETDLLARAADVWETKLGSPDNAAEILEKILARQPGYVPALTRLARIYEAAGEWDKCGATLKRALELKPTGRAAADLYYRLGRVTEAQSGDLARALPNYEKALAFDPAHEEAITELERAAREGGDYARLAGLLEKREAAETDPAKKLAVCLELADLLRTKLNRAGDALVYLELADNLAPDNAQVTETLGDLYFAAGRPADAEPLYRRLADKARTSRRPKDLARIQQRLGALREAAGDVVEALKSYEEAFRVDPAHGPTMAGLGRLYFGTGDWEKARRVYRSMLLQNLDPSLGVSKADVYLYLGMIHAKLGEGPKAKGMYERGLELDPTHAGLKRAMADVH